MSNSTSAAQESFNALFIGSLIPLHACLVGLAWIIHDYFVTLEDEIRYIWTQKGGFGKYMFFWIRYYSIVLLIFDVLQIHLFSRPGITNDTVCVAMDSIIRVVGAISLWSIEIIMQLRVYALYKCSKKVALVNATLFTASIGLFLWILIHNALRRHEVIAAAIHLPLPGCPSIHTGIEWAQWVPATCFEGVLFGFALYKTLRSAGENGFGTSSRWTSKNMNSLYEILLRDNILYFFAVTCLLVFNNLMVVGVTKIPWFSYSPFHAALGILTTRMLLNLRKASVAKDAITESTHPPDLSGSRSTGSMGAWNVASRGLGSDFSGDTLTVHEPVPDLRKGAAQLYKNSRPFLEFE